MPALVPGFACDVFISYRHKDNAYDGWVTAFVQNLKRELGALFKEDVSIYCDSNLEDGIHDIHNVDKSLSGKLRTLVFIPILSQTYCDPKSFAWQQEFIPFNQLAATDQFGKDVRIRGGNFTSRVLPVRIHDLDEDDLNMLKAELGGQLRAIDFVYKERGVNRPLLPDDTETRNLNQTTYRNQINKVANAVKEIITSLQHPVPEMTAQDKSRIESMAVSQEVKPRKFNKKLMAVIAGAVVLITAASIGSVSLFSRPSEKEEVVDVDRSIVVLPFVDMSADKDQEYFSDGLSEELLNVLANHEELKVISRTSAFSFKNKNVDVREIATKLGVAYVLEGSVRKSSGKIRVTVQLIKASDGSHIWSQSYDRDMSELFKMQDEIAGAVATQLLGKLLGGEFASQKPSLPEVYNLWMMMKYFQVSGNPEEQKKAIALGEQALALDSTDARIWAALGSSYYYFNNNVSSIEESNDWKAKGYAAGRKAIKYDDNLADGHRLMGQLLMLDWKTKQALISLHKALALNPGDALVMNNIARALKDQGNLAEAKKYFLKAIEVDPLRAAAMSNLSYIYAYEHSFDEARKLLNRAITINDYPLFRCLFSTTYLLQGDFPSALDQSKKINDSFWQTYITSMIFWGMKDSKAADEKLAFMISEFGQVGAYQIAEIYSYRDDRDNAFKWLNLAYELRDPGLQEIHTSPFLEKLNTDPRFDVIVKKLQLEDVL